MNFKKKETTGLHDGIKIAHHFLLDQGGGSSLTQETFHSLLQECSKAKDLRSAKEMYTLMSRYGHSDPSLDAHFIRAYALCGGIIDANALFSGIKPKTTQTWNAIVFAHVCIGEAKKALELYEKMEEPSKFMSICILKACTSEGIMGAFQASDLMGKQGIPISKNIILCFLQGCLKTRDIVGGRYVYSLMVISHLDSNAFLADYLIRLFVVCCCLPEAKQVFDKIKEPSIYTWTAIIAGHADLGESERALDLYNKMSLHHQGMEANKVLILSLLKACSNLDTLVQGRLMHAHIMELELDYDIVICNTVMDMYAKCVSLEDARDVFDKLRNFQDVVSWGVMISGYAKCDGLSSVALELYKKVSEGLLMPSKVILVSGLKACGNIEAVNDGRFVHYHAVQYGYESDINVGTTLVDMYAKCGCLEDAYYAFESLSHQNVVSWGAIIGAYVEHEQNLRALSLFDKMQESGVVPNRVIFLNLMRACSSIGACNHSKLIHDKIIRCGIALDVVVGSTLVDMYAKCEKPEATHRVFQMLPERNIVSWSALIGAYVHSGIHSQVESSLKDMQEEGIEPDKVILSSVLTAYTRAGLLEEGHQLFSSLARRFKEIGPNQSHFNGIIDLLCRGGCLNEAKDMITSIPTLPDMTGWKALLTGCETYGNVRLGRNCFYELQEMDPGDAAGYMLLMSSICKGSDRIQS